MLRRTDTSTGILSEILAHIACCFEDAFAISHVDKFESAETVAPTTFERAIRYRTANLMQERVIMWQPAFVRLHNQGIANLVSSFPQTFKPPGYLLPSEFMAQIQLICRRQGVEIIAISPGILCS